MASPSRLWSLDAFRGFTMFLLIGEFSGLFHYLGAPVFNGGHRVFWKATRASSLEWVAVLGSCATPPFTIVLIDAYLFFVKQSVALCPPKPRELLRAAFISILRASFGT